MWHEVMNGRMNAFHDSHTKLVQFHILMWLFLALSVSSYSQPCALPCSSG